MTTAYDTLIMIAGLVEAGLQPAGRATATATAAPLREMASIGDRMPLTLADAHAGYAALGVTLGLLAGEEPGNVTARRSTCRQIAALIWTEIITRGHAYALGQPHRLGDVLAAVAERYAGAARQAAIAETSKREALELCAGARPMTMTPDEAAVLGADPAPTAASLVLRIEHLETLRASAIAHGEMAFAHLVTAASNGEVWARDRIAAAYKAWCSAHHAGAIATSDDMLAMMRTTDTSRPDGTTAKSLDLSAILGAAKAE